MSLLSRHKGRHCRRRLADWLALARLQAPIAFERPVDDYTAPRTHAPRIQPYKETPHA